MLPNILDSRPVIDRLGDSDPMNLLDEAQNLATAYVNDAKNALQEPEPRVLDARNVLRHTYDHLDVDDLHDDDLSLPSRWALGSRSDKPTSKEREETMTPSCACAHHQDGSTTTLLCPLHADTDPCLVMAQVTGRRRRGTIRRGVCTNCGHRESNTGTLVECGFCHATMAPLDVAEWCFEQAQDGPGEYAVCARCAR